MSSFLLRQLQADGKLDVVQVEALTGNVDGQGAPEYGSPVDFEARAVDEDKLVVTVDGNRIRTQLTLWIPPGQLTAPRRGDRVTWNNVDYIVEQYRSLLDTRGNEELERVRCRRE